MGEPKVGKGIPIRMHPILLFKYSTKIRGRTPRFKGEVWVLQLLPFGKSMRRLIRESVWLDLVCALV